MVHGSLLHRSAEPYATKLIEYRSARREVCAEAGVSIEAKSRDKRELRHQMPFGLPVECASCSLVSCGGCSESLASQTLVVELDTCIDEDGCLLFAPSCMQAHGIAREVEDQVLLLA